MKNNKQLSVPTTVSEISPAWLKSTLASSFPEATLTGLQSQRIGADFGFASQIYRYRWQDNGTPQSIIVKYWHTNTKASVNEIRFYHTFRNVGIRIPFCYYGAVDESLQKAILLLEDFEDAVQGDVLKMVGIEQAVNIAVSLAKLHVTWLTNPILAEHSWINSVSTWLPDNDWLQSRRALFLERFPDRLNGPARRFLDRIEEAPELVNDRLEFAPTTLLHGDFHLDNLLFEKQTTPILLDWSRPLSGPAVINLADLLFCMIPLENFDHIFEAYLAAYSGTRKNITDKTNWQNQLGGAFLRKFTMSTCGLALWQPTLPRAVKIIEKTIENVNVMTDFWYRRDPKLFL